MIYVSQLDVPAVLSREIIRFFNDNLLKTYVWDETRVLSMDKGGIGKNNLDSTYYKILNLSKEVKKLVNHDDRFKVLQNVEIVKYPCGAHKNYHYDSARPTTTGASITYLNDDYVGGHTVVEGVDVQPITGRTVYFDGLEFRHAVTNVIKRDRYTISMWYGSDPSMPLNDDFLEI
tara:strand:- start:348 stop:872 length:525 start_codon:yes stop_codon:yes gene_type:complete